GFPVGLAEQLGGVVAHRRDDLVGELFTVHIDDVEIRVVLFDLDLDGVEQVGLAKPRRPDRKSTRLNSSHGSNSYAVFCLKKKKWLDHFAFSCITPDVGLSFFWTNCSRPGRPP